MTAIDLKDMVEWIGRAWEVTSDKRKWPRMTFALRWTGLRPGRSAPTPPSGQTPGLQLARPSQYALVESGNIGARRPEADGLVNSFTRP
jgi:hypothetical protein